MTFQDFFEKNGWSIVDVLTTEPREAGLYSIDNLSLGDESRAYLQRQYPAGIYRHQQEAIRRSLAGEDVCLVTGTASGKSLVFQSVALDLLDRDPDAKVMAIYPMKALGNEQRDRWHQMLAATKIASPERDQGTYANIVNDSLVGRIDGNVPPGFRLNILDRSRVVVFTPDIIHAWLFSNLNQPQVLRFLSKVRLIVVDEVHAYSGVFGSNSAFLFRRLQHLMSLLDANPRYICASATIAQPDEHLRALFGKPFSVVGPECDTSPRYPLEVILSTPPGQARFLEEIVQLLEYLSRQAESRFIAFVDSRKQVELISAILNRLLRESAKAAEAGVEEEGRTGDGETSGARKGGWRRKAPAPLPKEAEEADPEGEVTGLLQNLNVLPYRAGYEDHDRREIQERLSAGKLNGVVSTSALELGIDIPHLDICVLIGVPASATSLQQRIGRIGRHRQGTVIVVNGGDVHDQAVYVQPKSFFQRPLAESTLYLENEHIQYIHALCLARPGGEHDTLLETAVKAGIHLSARGRANAAAVLAKRKNIPFTSPVNWPENFIVLCQKERSGESPRHLVSLKTEAHDRPNYTFPLRDVESQFKVERRDGPNVTSMGSISFAQLMREAYPGAIYYYATIPYRVTRVNVKAKVVQVRREKRYTTQPQKTLPAVFPRLTVGGIQSAGRMGNLLSFETGLLVRESIRGVVEQRGRNENIYTYPLSRELGYFQDQPYFSRNYFTTGVVLTHPALAVEGVNLEQLASILYEAFMMIIPFERQDIGFAADRFRTNRGTEIREGQPFLTIYDQIYGSLRLSSRLLDPHTLARVLAEACFLAGRQEALRGSPASLSALVDLARAAFSNAYQPLVFSGASGQETARDPERWERIVLPGSKGLMVRTNEEFHVLRIIQTPAGLHYEGTPASMLGTSASVMPLLSDVAEIPGESQVGWYDIQSETVEAASGGEDLYFRPEGPAEQLAEVDVEWLRNALSAYLDGELLASLADQLSAWTGDVLEQEAERVALIDKLITACPAVELVLAALESYTAAAAAQHEETNRLADN